jgi:Tol biopolymer transport system component/serine/threonine protein kinase
VSTAALRAGEAFGPYRILSFIGQGGGGVVHRAWDPRLEREVALKVLPRQPGADSGRAERFVAEARAASALNHPNIVTVFDAAFDNDTLYMVSELIDGSTLRDEIGKSALSPRRILEIATQVADGLAAAHEAGIVHRDIKPENVMLTRSGRAKIVDFGLAQPTGFQVPAGAPIDTGIEAQTETDAGLRAGTVPYMSPEQARGAASDFRSDQFSFGLVLFEMTLGHSPFKRASAAATLDAIINDEASTAPLLDRRMPPPFRWIVDRCLAKKPDERYASTADLHRDLATLRDRFGEVVTPQPPVSEPARKARWRRSLFGAGVAAAVLVGAIVVTFNGETRQPAFDGLTFTPLATEPGYEGMPAWSPDGQTIAYVADVDGTLQIFARQRSASASAQVTQAPYDCRHPFWSPDGKRLYFISLARERESLWSIGAAGGTPQVIVENVTRAAISPDGQTIAFLRDEQPADVVGAATLWFWTASGGERKYEGLSGHGFIEAALAFSPDGRMLAMSAVPRTIGLPAAERGWQLWVVPLPGGQAYRRLQRMQDVVPRVTSLAWMPDSRHVVLGLTSMGTAESHLWMADLDGDQAWLLTRGTGNESYPASSPDGRQVAFSAEQSDYDVVEISGDGGRRLFGGDRNESDPAWSADQNLLAYVTDRGGQDEIWVSNADGRSAHHSLVGQTSFGDDRTIMLASPVFSPDGRRIAYQRNAQKPLWPLRIWISQTAGGPPVPLLPPSVEGYQSAATWSPDGEWIAYADWTDRRWRLAKVRVGDEHPIILRSDGVANAAPEWSPTGEWITWETDEGFILVSPDGTGERVLSDEHWLAHTWAHDGRRLFGIRETEDLRLSLVSVDVPSGRGHLVADLGPSSPVNNPVKGLSVSADGRRFVTSVVRLRGDVWTLGNVSQREPFFWARWFSQ